MAVLLFSFLRSERGNVAVEYGLIAALMTLALIAGLAGLAGEFNDLYRFVTERITAALN